MCVYAYICFCIQYVSVYLGIYLPARRRPQGLVVIGVCLSVCLCALSSAQVCVPLGHSSLYFYLF